MRFADILRLCMQNLSRRKSRTVLTVLGVVVGCCSIVLMVSFGQGINEQNERMLKSMGDLSVVTVYPAGSMGGSADPGAGAAADAGGAKLDDKAVESFRALAGVDGVTPVMTFRYNVTAKAGVGGRYIYDYVQVMGIDMAQFDAMGFRLEDGVKPSADDRILAGENMAYGFVDSLKGGAMRMRADEGSCTIDENTGRCLGNAGEDPYFDPLTTPITLVTGVDYQGDPYMQNLYGGGAAGAGTASGSGASGGAAGGTGTLAEEFKATGVVKADYNKGYATGDGIVMDLKAMKALIARIDPPSGAKAASYDQVLVKAADLAAVPQVESGLKAMGYDVSSYEDIRKSIEDQSRAIQLILGGIGAVSLLVAAIGIANTMIMSVSERTREIGVMKALGCYVRDIRVMFLTEAGAIGFIGGLIGAALSAFVSLAINMAGMWYAGMASGASGATGSSGGSSGGPSLAVMLWHAVAGGEDVTRYSVIPWWLYVFAVLFATLIGLVFGFGPANKAVRIPALDAIRNVQ